MEDDYECPKCHNKFPSANKLLHDFRCTKENPLPLEENSQMQVDNQNNQNPIINNSSNMEIEEENSPKKIEIQNEQFQIKSEIPQIKESNNFEDFYICDICNLVIPNSSKTDHLYCHNLEQKEKELINNNLLNVEQINIDEQKKIEKQIKMEKKIEEQKRIENQIKLQNQIQEQRRIEEEIKRKNEMKKIENQSKQLRMIQQQRQIEEQIKKQNEMRRQREILNQQNQMRRINPLIGHAFLQPVRRNYEHPTDKNILNELPENTIDDVSKLDNEKKNCLICLDDFKIGDKTTVLPCIHFFHSNCIKMWLKSQNTCPICKFKLIRRNVHQ